MKDVTQEDINRSIMQTTKPVKDAIVENIRTIYDTLIKNRPASVKGQYLEKMSVSSTMGPGIKIDHASIR